MIVKLVFRATVKDTEDMRGLCEQIGMCFEELGSARLISVSRVSEGDPARVGRGPYKNVMLSDEGMRELAARLGAARAEAMIADFSYKLYQKGYRFKDHFAVLLEWAEGKTPSSDGKAQSFDVDEFFRAAVIKGGIDNDA